MRFKFAAAIVAVGLCLIVAGVTIAAESNVYWRVDLNQGTSIIAYGQGATEQAAWEDCYRLRATTRAMTAAETRKSAVSAVTTSVVRWCKNPMQYATVTVSPSGTAALSWGSSTLNVDGGPVTNLAGYRISYGASATALTQAIQIANPAATSYVVSNLAPGTYYFTVRAYTSTGNESAQSNTASKVVN